jgi:hypothetical protein
MNDQILDEKKFELFSQKPDSKLKNLINQV